MAVTHWWLGEATQTTATVVCRSNATGTVSVTCGGGTFTGSADTGVKDGIVAITVTGLSAGQAYAYEIDGAPAGTLKTHPINNDVWIASGSCWNKGRHDILSDLLLANHDIDLFLALGDFPYTSDGRTAFGETTSATHGTSGTMAAGKSIANYYAHHRQIRLHPGIKELMRSVPFFYMPDDHEYPYNDARKMDLAAYQADVTDAGSATQDDLDEAWAAARTGIEAYATGFTFASTDDADAIYGAYRIGPVEVFVVDCINYADPVGNTDDASKTMLGANQKAWLLGAVTASTAPFKLIATGKQLWKAGGNTDTWNACGANLGYETEKAEILYALRNVTGLLAVAGDQHMWSDQWVSSGDLGVGYPAMSCLVGCPTTVDCNATSVAGYATGVRSKWNGYSNTVTALRDNAVALFRFTQSRVYRYHLTTRRGLIPRGYIDAGSNQVQYERSRLAI